MPTDQEGRTLLHIGDQEIEHEKNVLVVADEGPIMHPPRYQSVHDERDQGESGPDGEHREDRDWYEAISKVTRKGFEAIRAGKVGVAFKLDSGCIWRCIHGCSVFGQVENCSNEGRSPGVKGSF